MRARLKKIARNSRYRLFNRDPLFPPPWLHAIGNKVSDFRATGQTYLRHFIEAGGLKPTDRVLDIGSGTGRMAAPLTTFLTSGTYDGIELVKPSVEWCRKAYARYPNFRFHHADLYNKRYNRSGARAADYRFPFDDEAFDFTFLISVFTHMLPADVANYLREIRRTLSDGGKVLVTAFLLNDLPRTAGYAFSHDVGGAWADDPEVPERATAYDEPVLVGMIDDAGLRVAATHYGSWRGSEGLDWQDILILERRDDENNAQPPAGPS